MTNPINPTPINALPPAPLLTDTPAQFNDKAFPFVAALDGLRSETNTIASQTNQNAVAAKEGADDANAAKSEAEQARDDARLAANAAESSAAFYGRWEELSGPLNMPATVEHDGKDWRLMRNLADVTAAEPGVSDAWELVEAAGIKRVQRTSNVQLTRGDSGKLIDITSGTFTQTFDAAATLGDGWYCYLRNSGDGTITVDPYASEMIDGVTTGILTPGLMVLLTCDGAGFSAQRIGPNTVMQVLTSGTSWTCPMGVRRGRLRLSGGGASGVYTGGATRTCGGAGGYLEKILSLVPGGSYAYAVGAAGVGVSSGTTGAPGGNTTFTANGTTYMAYGGTASNQNSTNLGGNAVNGDINVRGGAGTSAASQPGLPLGGSNPLGSGGISDGTGATASGYGGGGGGSNGATGSGAPGVIILEY